MEDKEGSVGEGNALKHHSNVNVKMTPLITL